MAQRNEVLTTLMLLVDANLSFPPAEIEKTANVWSLLLEDVPGETLKQAALDYVMTGKDFPKLSEIRKRAEQVKLHNGVSAAPNPFIDPLRMVIVWEPSRIKDRAEFPPDIQHKIDVIIERIGDGLMSDAQIEYIDALTAPYRI